MRVERQFWTLEIRDLKSAKRNDDGTSSLAALVIQSPLEKQLGSSFPGHGNPLIACMKITSYNQHCSAPFPEPWSFNSCQAYSVEGADAVI
jgi:hypothetical protein